jgi:hypothetical protein
MNPYTYVFLGIAILLLILFVFQAAKSKNKKYKVTLADNSTLELTRRWNDGWNDTREMKAYHQGDKRIVLATHWIIKVEEM